MINIPIGTVQKGHGLHASNIKDENYYYVSYVKVFFKRFVKCHAFPRGDDDDDDDGADNDRTISQLLLFKICRLLAICI